MKFKEGDIVVVTKTEFTDAEWEGVGKVDVPFNIGDEFEIHKTRDFGKNIGLEFKEHVNKFWYPSVGFELKSEYEKEIVIADGDLTYIVDFLRAKGIE